MRGALLAGAAVLFGAFALGARGEDARVAPAPVVDLPPASGLQTMVVSGGCFWGVQGVFEHVRGVERAVAGYAGGARATASYDLVSTGTTGHAESVAVTYNPKQVSFGRLLQIFFSVALDPTEKDRQGPDEGTQYRSEIWASNADQARVARAYIAQLNAAHAFARPIATRVDDLPGFYPAETYHQDFLEHNPDYPYIAINDIPKVEALQTLFPRDYAARPRLSGFRS